MDAVRAGVTLTAAAGYGIPEVSVAPGLLPAIDAPRMKAQSTQPTAAVPPGDTARTIRAWRLRLGFTQEGLARALNVTFSTVSRWENGHVAPSKLAWRAMRELAAARGRPLGGEDGNGPP